MKRIDDLAGATVTRIQIGRNGTMHVYLTRKRDANGGYNGECEWSPLRVEIPKEPKKRRSNG